jgi:exodeoxyribonuclease V gamma subunit
MLNLIFSNRHAALTRRLLADLDPLASGRTDPFVSESIIVPGTAIRRQLELDWAREKTICTNVRFGFLAQWIWQQLARVVDVSGDSPFAPEKLVWRIFGQLGDASFTGRHPRLAAYLVHAESDPLMRFELAQRVARLFDQYITYRQTWVNAWAAGQPVAFGVAPESVTADQAWQADLWRALLAAMDIGSEHPAEKFFQSLNSATTTLRPNDLPPRVSVFCLPDIPPLYLNILAGLSRMMDIHLYVLNPCRHFWNEITTSKRMAHLEAEGKVEYHEVGNPLLGGWGRQTQGLLQQLAELPGASLIEDELYSPDELAPAPVTLLHRVQRDILDLVDPAQADESVFEYQADDQSIQIHVCHSLTRQLEVLHDQLLDLFDRSPDLTASDVLVVMPNLEDAAPLITAVFETAPPERRIPIALTGLPRAKANPVAAGLIELLTLLPSRFKASEVFALLRHPLVALRYKLSADDLETLHRWMREADIHWGLNAAHRSRLDLPAETAGSLGEGLDRLFLAYATLGMDTPLAGHLPAGWVEGSSALALGAFDQCVAELEAAAAEARQTVTGQDWCQRISRWLDGFFESSRETLDDTTEVRRAIEGLGKVLEDTGVMEPLNLDVIAQALTEQLEASARGATPEGRVTFAGLGPMRGLPYRVICALGLDDTVFPSVNRPDEFDLLAQGPAQLGDRQRGRDDRNLFLDLVLAARDRLNLSHTGRSIRDDSELTPSILLAELSDYLVTRTGREDRPWQHCHPLQAFSPKYFTVSAGDTSGPWFSYVEEYASALGQPMQLAVDLPEPDSDAGVEEGGEQDESARLPGSRFFTEALPRHETDARDLSLDDLIRFFRNPCQYLLQRRLQVTLAEAEEELVDEELFLPAWNSPGRLADQLRQSLKAETVDPESLRAVARACGAYPPGYLGERLLEQELGQLTQFTERLREAHQGAVLAPVSGHLDFAIDGETWRLVGEMTELRAGGLVCWRYDELRPNDRLGGWIQHLFLNALAPVGVDPVTHWIARTGGYQLPPVADASERLSALVTLYREGQTRPLPFFPKSAWAYAEAWDEAEAGKAIKAARKKWEVGYSGYGESTGSAYALALRGVADPLDDEFEGCARGVFLPFMASVVMDEDVAEDDGDE